MASPSLDDPVIDDLCVVMVDIAVGAAGAAAAEDVLALHRAGAGGGEGNSPPEMSSTSAIVSCSSASYLARSSPV